MFQNSTIDVEHFQDLELYYIQDIYEILDKEVRRHVAKGGAALGWEAA